MSSLKKIDASSGNACHSGLNIFSIPPTQVSINKSEIREILPTNSIEESPYEFRIFNDNQWLDLSKTYLYMELSLQKKSGNTWVAIEDTDTDVAPVNSLATSFIRQLKLYINGSEVYDSSNLYPFLTYIKNELSFSKNMKDSLLTSSGYFQESKIDNKDDNSFKKRVSLMKEGKIREFMTRLDFDLGNQSQFMLNNLDLLFTIYKADDDFLIQTLKNADTNTYRIRVHSLKLYVKTIDVQSSLNLNVLKMLNSNSAKYGVRRHEIRSCFISANRTELTYNVFSNIIPRRIVFALVDSTAYKGSLKHSPFNFQPFDLREITVNAGGLNYPSVRYDMSFSDDHRSFMRAFIDMHSSTMSTDNTTNGITVDMFKKGWNFFIVNLSSTLDDCCGFELIRSGTTTVHLLFNSPVQATGITLIMIGEFDQLLSIDQNRVIISDGTV